MVEQLQQGDLIVVYGSLQRGEYPYRQLGLAQSLRFIAPATFTGALYSMGDYPACTAGDGTVHGELFEVVDVAVGEVLDAFERFDPSEPESSLYVRVRVDILQPSTESAGNLKAWTYLYNQDLSDRPLIDSGHWLDYKASSAEAKDFRGFAGEI